MLDRTRPAENSILRTVKTKMMRAPVQLSLTFEAQEPQVLFEGPYQPGFRGQPNYDVHPDGQQFLMVLSEWEPTVTEVNIVTNWFAELQRIVAQPAN